MTAAALHDAAPQRRQIIAALLIAMGGTLAAGHLLRAGDWAAAWSIEKKDLAEAPLAQFEKMPRDANVVFDDPLEVHGAPIFTEIWDLNSAMHWKYPQVGERTFVVYQRQNGALRWDGDRLAYEGQPAFGRTRDVYIWKPSQATLTRATGPFQMRKDGGIDY
jgi:hypothetical protein